MKPSGPTNRYTCYHCGCHFEELDVVEEKPHHWIGVCPRCGRSDRLLSSNDVLTAATTGARQPAILEGFGLSINESSLEKQNDETNRPRRGNHHPSD